MTSINAPLTEAGEIVVNEVLISNYIAREWIYNGKYKALYGEMLYLFQHRAVLPYRLFCAVKVNECKDETSDDNTGFSLWVAYWFSVEQWYLGLSPMWQAAFLWVIVAPIAMVAVVAGKMVTVSLSSSIQLVAGAYLAIHVWQYQAYKNQRSKS